MTLLSKSVLGCALLSGVMSLTACQSMPMNQNHMSDSERMTYEMAAEEMLADAHVIKVLSVANKGEILQAQAALPNLKTEQARSFAQNMIDKHSMNEQKGQALAKHLNLVPTVSHTSNALQLDSNKIVTKLNQTAAPADKVYIMSQIDVHSKVLNTIDNKLLPSTTNPQLRNFLVETRSAVAMHLQAAKQMNAMMP